MKVENTQFWAKITGRAHVRGGRDHFTARKFDQIRSRFDKFGDFLAKIIRLRGFSRFIFYLVFKICLNFQSFSECRLIFFILITFFFNFLKVQNTLFWAKITGRAHVVDPGVGHEPRRFFDAFWREIKTAKFQDLSFRSKTSYF